MARTGILMASFLFNNVIIDIGDPATVMKEAGLPLSVEQAMGMDIQQLYVTLQDAVFKNPLIARNSAKHVKALGALVMLRTQNNAVLAVPKEGARSPADVVVRFRLIEEVVMQHLARLQSEAMLTFTAVNIAIWSKAA